jgi:hypothetical protein
LNIKAITAAPAACPQVRKGSRKAKPSIDMWTNLRVDSQALPELGAPGWLNWVIESLIHRVIGSFSSSLAAHLSSQVDIAGVIS